VVCDGCPGVRRPLGFPPGGGGGREICAELPEYYLTAQKCRYDRARARYIAALEGAGGALVELSMFG